MCGYAVGWVGGEKHVTVHLNKNVAMVHLILVLKLVFTRQGIASGSGLAAMIHRDSAPSRTTQKNILQKKKSQSWCRLAIFIDTFKLQLPCGIVLSVAQVFHK